MTENRFELVCQDETQRPDTDGYPLRQNGFVQYRFLNVSSKDNAWNL
jgi:hypothetical protein